MPSLQQMPDEAQDIIPRVLKKYSLAPPTTIAYKNDADLKLTFANEDDAQEFSKFIVDEKNAQGIVIFFTVDGATFSTRNPQDLMALLNTLDKQDVLSQKSSGM
jgi:hypothetical protein